MAYPRIGAALTTTIHLEIEPSAHHPGVTYAAIRAELQREADARARLYPKRVESGRLTQADAERERALIAAMLADVTRMASYAPPDATGITWRLDPGAEHDFTWKQRRFALHRELDMRARLYPQWIAEGRLAQPDANRRTAALECLLELYDEGWGFPPVDPESPAPAKAGADRSADFAANVWPATRTAQSRIVKQEEMAL